ncbi:MAG: transglycosylase domain-containing protein, partial [Oscillospiraceae bacterium]|nr:transglycosylase domain-containing protein [Oscillospiraceae bacterium]
MSDTNQNRAPERREPQAQPGGRREPRSRRKRRRRPIWLTIIIRFFQVIGTLLLIGVITGCFMVCYAVVYVKTVVMPQTYLRLEDYAMNENSVIYYQDKSTGMLVELQTLSGEENRELIEYDQIPEDLINAIIAVEDKRFPTHNGVDWRRTASGLLRMFTGGNIQGGSTITQQSIKNATGRNDVTVNRKILEIFSALELENNYTKKDIITFYLNYIYLGNRCYGVQAASKYYFGKDVWDLSLAECASLAGITNNPSLYAPYGVVDVVRYQCQNPECKLYSLTKDDVCEYCGAEHSYDNGSVWTNREFNKARQETILKLMADPEISPDGAYITEAERDAAIAQPLVFKRDLQAVPDDDDANDADTKTSSALYSWYVEEVITEAIEALVEETGMSPAMCEQRVLNGGLSIICAYDPEAQSAVDTVFNDRSNLDQVSSKTGQRLMSAISVVDNSTGYVVALGSTAEKTVNRGSIWPVTTTRQPGSSIKPLSVYGPAIEMGLITPASVIDDNPYLLNGKVWPLNVSADYRGLTTVQYAVTVSLNTVALRVVEMVTPQASYDFMVNKFGFTSMEPYYVRANGQVVSDIDRSPLSMGGLTWGVSTFEMAAAYATFPRNGEFTKATT